MEGGSVERTRSLRWLYLIGVIGAVTLLAGVTAAASAGKTEDTAPTTKAARTTVTLAGWSLAGNRAEQNALLRTIAQFERRNPNIDVDYQAIAGDYDAAMLARFAARRPPDVFYVDSLDVPDYLPALEPLNDDIRRNRFSTRQFFPRLLNAFRVRGQIYGFPKDWSSLGLVGNTQMLNAAGIRTPPKTWAQFTSALQRLRARNAVPNGAPACLSLDWARILAFIYQNRGAWLNPARTRSLINSPQNRATVTQYLGWFRSGLARTPEQLGVDWCGQALGEGKAAFIFEGNWVVGFMQTGFSNVRYRIYPMLRQRAGGNLAFTVAYSIGRFSSKKAAAWRLLAFLTGPVGMRTWTSGGIALPSRRDVRVPPGRAALVNAAPSSRPWQFVSGFDRVVDLAGKELEATFEGNQTVAQMLQKIDAATKEALER
jgi:multiple sugar transport system substrate-binding protein